MDEPSREDGRMRRFQPRSRDINLGAAGGSPCDLCSLRRDVAAETPPTHSQRCFRPRACFPSYTNWQTCDGISPSGARHGRALLTGLLKSKAMFRKKAFVCSWLAGPLRLLDAKTAHRRHNSETRLSVWVNVMFSYKTERSWIIHFLIDWLIYWLISIRVLAAGQKIAV